MSIAKRLEDLEARENVTGMLVTENPNGNVDSVATTIAIDTDTSKVYICLGGTVWKEVSLV